MENEQSVDVSEFLGEMEAGGVKPNRATYQHLIGNDSVLDTDLIGSVFTGIC